MILCGKNLILEILKIKINKTISKEDILMIFLIKFKKLLELIPLTNTYLKKTFRYGNFLII